MSKVLITGASGGFGKLTVQALLKKGHKVAATLRDAQGKNRAIAQSLTEQGALVIDMDVTKEASVTQGITSALQKLEGLDVVINNAGVGVLGIQETFTPEDWQRIFDVNLFGVQRVNRAILPYFRERHSGLLIHVSSLLGRITVPFYGPYNASKWALEALVENYRSELSGFGVECCLVEPGGFPTSFIDNLVRPSDKTRDASLGTMPQEAEGFLQSFEKALSSNPAQNPQLVADAMVHLVESPAGKRAFRTVVDNMGMGDHIKGYNESLGNITSGIYNAFGIGQMLTLKTTK